MTVETYNRYESTLNEIRVGMKQVHHWCDQTSTIERANKIFKRELEELKRKAYSKINTMDKPHIIYLVNRYYHSVCNA